MQTAFTHLPFDAYVVLDFEATCEPGRRIEDQEVIEFPFVVVDAQTAAVVTEFQRYVRPLLRPKLSDYCRELTGITQEAVDHAQPFPIVFQEALSFLRACNLGDGPGERRYCMVTCGDWDLKTMLPKQIQVSSSSTALTQCRSPTPSIPQNWFQWCNIKKFVCTTASAFPNGKCPTYVSGMMELLHRLGLSHTGREHSGIDDCRNIAAVVCALLKRGCYPYPTWSGRKGYSGRYTVSQGQSSRETTDIEPMTWPPSDLDSYTRKSIRNTIPGTTTNAKMVHDGPLSSSWHVDVEHAVDGTASTVTVTKSKNRLQSLPGDKYSSSSSRQKQNVPHTTSQAELPEVQVNTNPDEVNRLVEQLVSARTKQTYLKNTSQVSKALSFILRHHAVVMNIPISTTGFVRIDHILASKIFPLRDYSVADAVAEIVNIVRKCPKKRFKLGVGVEDPRLLYIAANQGHSIAGIQAEMIRITSIDQVPTAVHGTNLEAWEKIKKCGYMSCMNRLHIHFAKGLPQDGQVISGMRTHSQVLLYLDVSKVLDDGIPLLESANGVILTPGVGSTRQLPLKYFSQVCDRQGKSLI